MTTFYIYDKHTGIIRSRLVVSEREQLSGNIPDGCEAQEAHEPHDMRTERIDPDTREFRAYVPPAPGTEDDFQWNLDFAEWELLPELQERRALRDAALARLAELEAKASRPLRELALNDAAEAAKKILEEIELEATRQRAIVNANQ